MKHDARKPAWMVEITSLVLTRQSRSLERAVEYQAERFGITTYRSSYDWNIRRLVWTAEVYGSIAAKKFHKLLAAEAARFPHARGRVTTWKVAV